MLYIRAYDENVRTKRRHPSKEGSPTMMMSTLFPAMMRLILRADVRPLSARGLARRRRRFFFFFFFFFFFWRETERSEFSSLRLCRQSLALLQRRDGVLLFFLSFPSPVGGICARACAHGRDDPAAKNGDGAPPEAVEGRQSSHFVSETHFSTSRGVVLSVEIYLCTKNALIFSFPKGIWRRKKCRKTTSLNWKRLLLYTRANLDTIRICRESRYISFYSHFYLIS